MSTHLSLAQALYNPSAIEHKPTRDGYGDALVELGHSNPNVVVLSGDLTESMRAQQFAEQFPDRFIQVGVAEQNMMGLAAGLALSGKIPFVSSYAVFSPGRNWDQLRVSVCYSQTNVKVAGGHTGISIGADGATHQALEDIAMTRVLPNLIVVAPCDYWETKKTTLALSEHLGPAYFRFTREKTPVMTTAETPFAIGQAYVMREGHDVSVIGCGPLLFEALQAADTLAAEGISVEVINSHTIKPLDRDTILASVSKTGAAVTVEEHQRAGGLGGAVAELLSQELPTPLEIVGVDDTFGESGKPAELLKKYGLTSSDIGQAIKASLARKTQWLNP